MKHFIDKTAFRFLLVGVINTIIGTGTMFLAYNLLGLSYWFSSAANYIIGSIVSYVLNKYFTFQNKEQSLKIVWKFILNIVCCYLIAYGVAKPLVRIMLHDYSVSIQENGAMLVGMGLFVVLNYFGQRYFAFKK